MWRLVEVVAVNRWCLEAWKMLMLNAVLMLVMMRQLPQNFFHLSYFVLFNCLRARHALIVDHV